jgi:hypothetical protein
VRRRVRRPQHGRDPVSEATTAWLHAQREKGTHMKRKLTLLGDRHGTMSLRAVAQRLNWGKSPITRALTQIARVSAHAKQSRVRNAVVVGLMLSAFVPAAATQASGGPSRPHASAGHAVFSGNVPRSDGTIGDAAAKAMRQGYLVANQAAYGRAKARANAKAALVAGETRPVAGTSAAQLAPVAVRSWDGLKNPNAAPSDSTGSVGSSRFVELINSSFALYDKTNDAPINTGSLNTLAGGGGSVFDPQIMWDPQTNRFYYAMVLVANSTTNLVATGFSKTASPNNGSTDFCHYTVNFGSDLPDYPKLGDSGAFWIVGSNVFNARGGFIGSDAFGISKPPAGTTCPLASSLKFGEQFDLRDPTGAPAFTPVPVDQIDNSSTGFIIARTGSVPSTRLSLHSVTKNATTGLPVFRTTGVSVTVPSYAVPPSAPQRSGFPNSAKRLDTLDARPTQAVSAIDPDHGNSVRLWVQHTTATNPVGRSEVRWYEINPVTATVIQQGKATSTAFFAFNGAISPDRARLGATGQFGNSMVLGFDTSSTTSFPAVRMVSKVRAAAQSAPVLVRSSNGNYSGFDCAGTDNQCRWGDFAGASPDPIVASGASVGSVWLVSQYASGVNSTTAANWLTRNWVASP